MRVRVIAAREFVAALRRLPTLSRSVHAAAVARGCASG
jgi:hypothetical protein